MTDLELVELARAGDADAFGELVSRHHRAALRAALAALGSMADAEDAVQDAWITARDRLDGFRHEASFRTWLGTIVWHKALDRRRSVVRWLRRQVVADEAGEAGPGVLTTLVAPGGSPETCALDTELQRTVRRLVRALPAKLRDPLLLVGSGEYSYDEVAALLRQPVGTIKWRVSEARRQLRIKLTRLGF